MREKEDGEGFMLRFLKVIVWNLPRIYMIPKMAYKARHQERYGEEACYAYARLAIRRMMRAGRIYTRRTFRKKEDISCARIIRENTTRWEL